MAHLLDPTTVPRIGITGVTGAVGGAVARLLSEPGRPVRYIVRDPSRLPRLGDGDGDSEVAIAEYGASDAAAALAGVGTLFMVSAAESPTRVEEHCNFVDQAVKAGVQHIVYTSFLSAAPDATFTLGRDHFATEEHIKASGMRWTFLRDNFYADVFEHFADERGVLRGPAGDGRIAPVARADVARVASAILAAPNEHLGRTYALTGPQALTLDEIAAILTQVRGREFRYERETVEQAYASRRRFNPQPFEIDAWVSTYTAIAAGECDTVSDDVRRIIGVPATTFEEVVASSDPVH